MLFGVVGEALATLPAELQARVPAAAAHAERIVVQRRGAGSEVDEEYEIYALTGDRLVHMITGLRADGSVAEATDTFLSHQIFQVVPIESDRAAIEVDADSGRRSVSFPAEIAAALRLTRMDP